MAHVKIRADDVDLSGATLVEGLPGAGLVGKIAADHLADEFDMVHYADVHCEGIPRIAVYGSNDSDLQAPVRLQAAPEQGLVVLQSDVPVSPSSATGFAECITGWIEEEDVTPVYVSGMPVDDSGGSPELYGVATGDGEALLDEAGIVPPRDGGAVTGPTGALLARANERDLDSIGLIAETEARFPDPNAASVVLEGGIEPLTGIDVNTDELLEHAEEISRAREQLARQLQDADDESSEARPLRMFQ